ncbi:MAG: YbaB/EbfC family nucleoid-associated protein [Epsilonproteobacteria bacterium]|nr:YbaB/EbfC family nucleoid-associated protein [Campylobacterota bacterium]OIO15383.1 MAG: nucleoid-associated protein, YbaB/EbfC family [Helicobacteraceae bacterium CG1_02_36_14]PIP10294.1 MAG: nucleoid-associated protein, YbaB/EbfC family [Sulfurimonas sp. CG23_combo_of_CG06-09_8_20_14_all_36_33]PIS26387.1 MAG: nucleoid-associated protein, YbaB/EbfC family [Sulfurimonas sp. CG08_land_8_20_14_0_20_36_33]PIU33849.1 MAG: nucleoid-associated protein, YbaB/EbfC family [Sulfurimonas sp. CG07_land_
MFSKLGDMNKMFEGMQENAKKLQAELESKVFSVKSGGGLLEVSMNGKSEVVDLSIDDSLMSDKQMLQILLIGAINDVNKMVQHNQQNSAMGMLGDMNLSGIK